MKSLKTASLFVVIMTLCAVVTWGQTTSVLFREDFKDLENWKPLSFPKIKQHSMYTIVKDGPDSYLKAESNASASGI